MNNDSSTTNNATTNNATTNDNAELTLADLQELSAALGAAAVPMPSGPVGEPSPGASTVMCPSHPWDR